jgi:hypothetical protein
VQSLIFAKLKRIGFWRPHKARKRTPYQVRDKLFNN